ncbi:hypothetical protein GCM10023310_46580 [Paenibacillus vulneris]|uniref:Response regulator n=1 Tax=Paenibacillus vulneris TaxID=1133364 RepID=A0ABW3UFB7_9BACL
MHPSQLLTVLVVDDELPLREELRLFPWHNSLAELVGEAENGEEAMELCRKLRPDVVITDITMPVMDGMDLFRRIKQEFPLTQVVLLTCHSDFAYAKEALKLGALEYLIKVSLLDTELEHVLNKAREAIQREYNYRRNEIDRQRWELTRLLSSTGKEPKRVEAIDAILKSWGVLWPIRIIRLHVSVRPQEEMFAHHELQSLLSERELTDDRDNPCWRWITLGPTDYIWIQRAAPETGTTILLSTRQWLERLQSAIDVRASYLSEAVSLYAVIGPSISSAVDLLSAIELTKLPAAAVFYDTGGAVYEMSAASGTIRPSIRRSAVDGTLSNALNFEMLTELMRQTAADKALLIEFCQGRLTEWVNQVRPEPAGLKSWLISNRKEWMGERDNAQQQELIQKLQASRTASELLSMVIREVENRGKLKYRKEVAQAIQLISNHIAEPITLTWAAERVGLSSFYLSRLFREEVGESFNEYVTMKRIDKAIHLLQTTSLKVYEVAEQVGIPSYRYFSVLFRSRTGVSPTEYKKGGAGE